MKESEAWSLECFFALSKLKIILICMLNISYWHEQMITFVKLPIIYKNDIWIHPFLGPTEKNLEENRSKKFHKKKLG